MNRTNYLFFSPSAGFGGLEIQMVKRADDAIKQGKRAVFVTLPNSWSSGIAKEMNIPCEFINFKHEYLNIIAARKLCNIINKHFIDICVVGKTTHLSIAVLVKKLFIKDLKIVLYQQLQSEINKKDVFHNWVYSNIDAAIVLTDKMKNDLANTTIFPIEKIKTIQYGIDTQKFNPKNYIKAECRKMFNLPQDDFLIGLVGRIEWNKGQSVAIKSFAKANIPNSKLVICGNIGVESYYQYTLDLINQLNLNDSIIYLPFTKDIPELMNAFDFFVLPSQSEAFGLVVIEAMAAGLPVVGTDSGGVPELIEHEKNGFLFKPKDYDTLAYYMKLLFENRALLLALGNQARQYSISKYDYISQTKLFFDFCEN